MIFCLLFTQCLGRLFVSDQFKNVDILHNLEIDFTCQQVSTSVFGNQFQDQFSFIYSGYLNAIPNSNSGLGFIFYAAQNIKTPQQISEVPTLIWLQGGPGSSSQLANLLEFGPLLMDQDGEFYTNVHSWHQNYNLMFIDQPIGTGLSYAQNSSLFITNQDQAGEMFYNAIIDFMTNPNGCVKGQNLLNLDKSIWFIFGESYAGKWVPTVTKYLMQKQQETHQLQIQIKGIAMGDPFTDPKSVLEEMPKMGFNLGLIDYQEYQIANQMVMDGDFQINNKQYPDAMETFTNVMNFITNSAGGANNCNIFDYVGYDALELKVENFFNKPEIKAAFGFHQDHQFLMANNQVRQTLSYDYIQSTCLQTLEWILQQGFPVLIYTGQNDLIVNTQSTYNWIHKLKFSGTINFYKTPFSRWIIGNKIVGLTKKSENLQLNLILNSGHLVPRDQPEAAKDMIYNFIESIK